MISREPILVAVTNVWPPMAAGSGQALRSMLAPPSVPVDIREATPATDLVPALRPGMVSPTVEVNFRTLLHSMPYHNPLVLASEIGVADVLLDGRYEFGVGRGHGWMPPKAGLALTPESRERYEESVELLFTALENERFSYDGDHFKVADSVVNDNSGTVKVRISRVARQLGTGKAPESPMAEAQYAAMSPMEVSGRLRPSAPGRSPRR